MLLRTDDSASAFVVADDDVLLLKKAFVGCLAGVAIYVKRQHQQQPWKFIRKCHGDSVKGPVL